MSDINVNLGGDIVRLLIDAEKLNIYLEKEWKRNWHKSLLTNLNRSYKNGHFGWAYLHQTHVVASTTTLINVDTKCRFSVHGKLFEHLKEGESMLFLFYFEKELKGIKRELISPTLKEKSLQNLLTHLSIHCRACVTYAIIRHVNHHFLYFSTSRQQLASKVSKKFSPKTLTKVTNEFTQSGID